MGLKKLYKKLAKQKKSSIIEKKRLMIIFSRVIFSRLCKIFVGLCAVEQVEQTTNPTKQYCRNWNGVDPEILPKLYSWLSDDKDHFIKEQECPIECQDYQYKTQKYFNASLITPYPNALKEFSDLCTIPCLPNEGCLKKN